MSLLSNWHFMRVLRAAIAVWSAFEFSRTHDWMFLAFGSLFALQAIFDVGCCGASGCAAPTPRHKHEISSQEIDYEEVK